MTALSDSELNRTLAELCGWKRSEEFDYCLYGRVGRGEHLNMPNRVPAYEKNGATCRVDMLPPFTTDLNACALVEAGLTLDQSIAYANLLWPMGYAVFNAITATARQRTIALIETLKP